MAPHWPRLKAMHLNTVLAPVSWELIEPVEGQFDWTSVDALLRAARANDLKLVMLWFGAWKNSMSTYAPSWVKRDQARFPRAALPDGRGRRNPLAVRRRDARRRRARLRRADGAPEAGRRRGQHGAHGAGRERDRHAARRARPQPGRQRRIRRAGAARADRYLVAHGDTLVPGMQRCGASAARGPRAAGRRCSARATRRPEVFTAWHFARFADQLAARRQGRYALPMYVNVALNRPGRQPGEYPSGGPLPHLLDVWKAGAPAFDFLAPDIYFPNFAELAARYHRPDNPLFIPEGHNADNPVVPANAFYAFGELDALGFAPFSIDSIDENPGALAAPTPCSTQLTPFILAAQGTGPDDGLQAEPGLRRDRSTSRPTSR